MTGRGQDFGTLLSVCFLRVKHTFILRLQSICHSRSHLGRLADQYNRNGLFGHVVERTRD
jgi:hypothetical protein